MNESWLKMVMPPIWINNNITGEDWLSAILTQNEGITMRTPEATSPSRTTSFNRHNVSIQTQTLESFMKRTTFHLMQQASHMTQRILPHLLNQQLMTVPLWINSQEVSHHWDKANYWTQRMLAHLLSLPVTLTYEFCSTHTRGMEAFQEGTH